MERETALGAVSEGNVLIARHAPDNNNETALVCVVSHDDDACEILLCHYEDRLATEHDRILSSDDTGLGYDLVVQTDIRAWTFADDISKVFAVVPSDVLANAQQGLRLKGRLDSRWNYKVSEVYRLHRLINRYLKTLLSA
jgi:hypothetical protein